MLDYATVDALRTLHPAWRLLRSDHAALIASFLHRVFVAPNVRAMAAADLTEALEDELYGLREKLGAEAFPKPALDYLNEWAGTDKGWLRKFYRTGSDETQFDLMPATEKAIAWLGTLAQRGFVGTESRLLTLFDLLKQMSEGAARRTRRSASRSCTNAGPTSMPRSPECNRAMCRFWTTRRSRTGFSGLCNWRAIY